MADRKRRCVLDDNERRRCPIKSRTYKYGIKVAILGEGLAGREPRTRLCEVWRHPGIIVQERRQERNRRLPRARRVLVPEPAVIRVAIHTVPMPTTATRATVSWP